MIVYPGNPKPSIRRYASIPQDNVNESIRTLDSHTGTHVDSRLHIRNEDKGTASLPIESFFGKCKVFDLTFVEKEIHRQDLEGFQIEKGSIVLLKTRNSTLGYTK
jgi:arylformamidase